MSNDYELREFVCKECGHKVVVKPSLPKDYTPNICTPCYEAVVAPRMRRNEEALMANAQKLFRLLFDPHADRQP